MQVADELVSEYTNPDSPRISPDQVLYHPASNNERLREKVKLIVWEVDLIAVDLIAGSWLWQRKLWFWQSRKSAYCLFCMLGWKKHTATRIRCFECAHGHGHHFEGQKGHSMEGSSFFCKPWQWPRTACAFFIDFWHNYLLFCFVLKGAAHT